MFLTKYTTKQPNYKFDALFGNFDDLFDQAFDRMSYSYSSRLKLNETDTHYELTLELPGYANKDLDVSVEDYILTVRAKNEKRGETLRKLVLWEGIDFDKLEAKLEDGLLIIKLPKQEKVKPKKIKVE
jgi:HSP20 family protein